MSASPVEVEPELLMLMLRVVFVQWRAFAERGRVHLVQPRLGVFIDDGLHF